MNTQSPSLARIIWDVSMPRTLWLASPALAWFLIAALGLRWFGGSQPTLAFVASQFELPLFLLGSCLLHAQQRLVLLRPGDKQSRGIWDIPILAFEAMFRRATHEPVADVSPGAAIVALPVFVGLGAASIGCCVGLALVLAHSPDGAWAHPVWLLLVYLVLGALVLASGAHHASRITRRLYAFGHEQAVLAVQARADADRARMVALQAQMNPHFLFNALNTVASLLDTDASRAERTVASLSSVLERTLSRSTDPLSTLDDELRFVREYLDIERERFGERLTVTFDIDQAATLMRVPTMSLQPLVENAIKHAIAEQLAGGHIQVEARVLEGELRLAVEDDGPGFAADSREGAGLGNLRQRLQSLYGGAGRLIVQTFPSGAKVTMAIPRTPTLRPHHP
jgi:signal transduction histidine kinase